MPRKKIKIYRKKAEKSEKARKVKIELIKTANEYNMAYSFVRKVVAGRWLEDELVK